MSNDEQSNSFDEEAESILKEIAVLVHRGNELIGFAKRAVEPMTERKREMIDAALLVHYHLEHAAIQAEIAAQAFKEE